MKIKEYLLAVTLFISSHSVFASSACHGEFPNLISDICWDCAMPIKLFGGLVINSGSQEDYDSGVHDALCACQPAGAVAPKAGFHVSFWEFARQIDVTRTPYCMVTLGTELDIGIGAEAKGAVDSYDAGGGSAQWFRHAHWYINPAMGLLEVMLDSKCLEAKGFDIGYMSEIDPTHIDEQMERILNPEAYLFGNINALKACVADCVASTAGFPLNSLFWCAGCNGSLYPMTGFLPASYGGVQASSLLLQKVIQKQHRFLTQTSLAGKDGMCSPKMQINMDKRQYKYSMIYPSAQSAGDAGLSASAIAAKNISMDKTKPANNGQATIAQDSQSGKCCQPLGRTTLIWGAGREIPGAGEDQGYALFRKRDCCQ